ncbi:hypothetical protein CPT_Margaery130 [Citrobacter phage Margaery]|uniref:Uncharacterized protein n=2 Tax=Pseudotevenvirus margaery TaxID=2843955 RepID=A0A0M3UL19_9CAUD|nr:hypothetical protein CPT_Margaery130 [Citrobacter phage Margaery]ALF01819.1 hypothetical protein CPT_Margaery130 [Citrobacter phage Margaery]AYJ72990.1 hypothetical protein CPT_Maroon_127 [Citrobacter phage Maroon]
MTDVILNVKDIVLGDKVKHPDAVTLEQAVVQIMRDSLRLEVTERTESNYTGGMNGRDLYEDSKHVNVTLWADIDENSYKIDEIDFDV